MEGERKDDEGQKLVGTTEEDLIQGFTIDNWKTNGVCWLINLLNVNPTATRSS